MAIERLGIREAVRKAEDCAQGILESQDDAQYWGDEFCDEHEYEMDIETMTRAREIIINRIRRRTR